MKPSIVIALMLTAPLGGMAQTTVFSDNFSTSTFNGVSTPTATSTSYDFLSSKTASQSIASGDLKMTLTAATTSGFVEAQALFTTTPVTLATVGDYINFTYTFTDTASLLAAGTASSIYTGLYNSGGSAPVAGTAGVAGNTVTLNTTAGSANATGNAANWQGYVGRLVGTGGNSVILTRPLQNGVGTTSANQDLVAGNVGGGQYANPSGAQVGANLASTLVLTTANQYTISYQITLTGAGALTISDTLYDGATTNSAVLSTQSSVATGAAFLTSSFDGLAIGVNGKGVSTNPQMDINSILITANIQAVPEPTTLALLSGGAVLGLMFRRRSSGN